MSSQGWRNDLAEAIASMVITRSSSAIDVSLVVMQSCVSQYRRRKSWMRNGQRRTHHRRIETFDANNNVPTCKAADRDKVERRSALYLRKARLARLFDPISTPRPSRKTGLPVSAAEDQKTRH